MLHRQRVLANAAALLARTRSRSQARVDAILTRSSSWFRDSSLAKRSAEFMQPAYLAMRKLAVGSQGLMRAAVTVRSGTRRSQLHPQQELKLPPSYPHPVSFLNGAIGNATRVSSSFLSGAIGNVRVLWRVVAASLDYLSLSSRAALALPQVLSRTASSKVSAFAFRGAVLAVVLAFAYGLGSAIPYAVADYLRGPRRVESGCGDRVTPQTS